MKKIKSITASVLLLASLAVFAPLNFTGCGTTAGQVTYDTLASVGAAVDGAMKGAAAQKVAGNITSAQWQQIAAKHGVYLVAYNAAVDGAAVALDKATVPANVAAAENDLLAIINLFLKK